MTDNLFQSFSSSSFANGRMELSGKPGQVWGSVVVPSGGKSTMRIDGDILQTTARMNYGLENKDILTRIQTIDAIEVTEGRMWWLLAIGFATLWILVGIIPIVLFFIFKQKWIVIYSQGTHLILFHKNTQQAREFRDSLMAIVRQLNAKSA